MREWLPQGHLAYFIGDTVHSLELQAFHDRYAKRGKDGKPEGGRYKREFGTPEAGAQENFTDGDSRIMKRAGGGFDPAYNAQLVVDEAAHIIVAAELTNNASDAAELPNVLKAVQANLGQAPDQVLGRHRVSLGGGVREQLAGGPSELVVALGQAAYRKRKWIAEPPNGWIKSVLGLRQFSLRGLHRVDAEWKLVCAALNLRRMCALQPA